MKTLESSWVEKYYKSVKYPLLRRFLCETENKARREISEFPVICDFIKWDYLNDYMGSRFNPHDLSRILVVDGFVVADRKVFDRKPIYMVDEESERALRAVITVQYFKNAERFYPNVVPLTIELLGQHPIAQRLNNIVPSQNATYKERHRFLNQPWINDYDSMFRGFYKAENVRVEQVLEWVKRNGTESLDPDLSAMLARILRISSALSRREALSLWEIKDTEKLYQDEKARAFKLIHHYLDQYPELYGNLGELYEDIMTRAVIRRRP